MPGKADLHIHTTCSDGKLTPIEAITLASESKLQALAITDHDTFEGYEMAKAAAVERDIELIPGMEITTKFRGSECHLLAYYFNPLSEAMRLFVLKQRETRRRRIRQIITVLNNQGIDVDYDEVWAFSNGANIGRPHLAKILIQKGYVANLHEAFVRYLSYEQLGGIESAYPEVEEAIEMVKNAGGAAIIAHPGRLYSQDDLEKLVSFGIDGIECIHPSHTWKKQLTYVKYCEAHSLLKTGGSDYHGGPDGGRSQVGIIAVTYKNVERMKRMTDQRKKFITLNN